MSLKCSRFTQSTRTSWIFSRLVLSPWKLLETFASSFLDENWLNTVYLSISPTHELMVFAHGSKLIFLSKTSSDGTNSSYTISWSGETQNQNEVVTSIICLPIFGYNVTSGAEWTSVAVGLSSGLVVFYTDSGIQIFSQRWAEEQVGFMALLYLLLRFRWWMMEVARVRDFCQEIVTIRTFQWYVEEP